MQINREKIHSWNKRQANAFLPDWIIRRVAAIAVLPALIHVLSSDWATAALRSPEGRRKLSPSLAVSAGGTCAWQSTALCQPPPFSCLAWAWREHCTLLPAWAALWHVKTAPALSWSDGSRFFCFKGINPKIPFPVCSCSKAVTGRWSRPVLGSQAWAKTNWGRAVWMVGRANRLIITEEAGKDGIKVRWSTHFLQDFLVAMSMSQKKQQGTLCPWLACTG